MTRSPQSGLLIVFEGPDGTGKSTQVRRVQQSLETRGFPTLTTREPTNGTFGKKIRELYVNRAQYSGEEELELFLADRREHVDTLLVPALQKGMIILCDRYYLSTAAYQGARGYDPQDILARNSFAPSPDLALVFHLPLEVAIDRITTQRGDSLNDFEQQQNLAQVAAIFDGLQLPCIRRIDAAGPIEDVHRRVMAYVNPLLATFLERRIQ